MMGYLLLAGALFLLWFSLRYAWWLPPVSYDRPRILMYHMISQPTAKHKFRGLRVDPVMFERQLAWLKKHGWQFVTMSQLANRFDELPAKTVAITFDDGFEDNYREALPLLKKYGAVATLYLVINRHDNDWSTSKKAHHDSGELMREAKLSGLQVREMLESGVFELGAHTISHCNLNNISDEEKQREIVDNKVMLEKAFDTRVSSFAYPFGIYSEEDCRLVKEAGYKTAVTTNEGIDTVPDLMQLKRVKISGRENYLAFVLRMRLGFRGYL